MFVAGMWFQDLWTYDFRRTEMCIIPYATQMGEISFCAYNTGVGWRQIVENMYQNASVADWYREHGKHAVYANPRKPVPLPEQAQPLSLHIPKDGRLVVWTPKRPPASRRTGADALGDRVCGLGAGGFRACEEIRPEVVQTFRAARHFRPKGLHYRCHQPAGLRRHDFFTHSQEGFRAYSLQTLASSPTTTA